MHERALSLTAADGTTLIGYHWSGGVERRSIVQLAHGMGEHAGRYRRLAEALVGDGHVVVAVDHRGHGRTAGSADRHGDLGPGGWPALVDDLGVVGDAARAEHPGLPLFVVGHSMGSFALQQYLLDHSDRLDGAALSGTSAVDIIGAAIDPDAEVDLSAFNAPFEPARTEYDWLSRDEAEVGAYLADPDCGFGLNAAGAASMLGAAARFGDPEALAAIHSDLPILVFSGAADPLAGGGELIQLVASRYRGAGVTDVEVILYPGARHEIFNETNRDEVTSDLLAWLDRHR